MTEFLLYFDGIMLLIAAAIYLKIVLLDIEDKNITSALFVLTVAVLMALAALWFFNAARGL